jgi:hypothetical protein
VALSAHDVIDFGLNPALLRCRGRRCSRLQNFGKGLEARLDRGRIETRHLRISAGGGGSRRWAGPWTASKISQDGSQNLAEAPLTACWTRSSRRRLRRLCGTSATC